MPHKMMNPQIAYVLHDNRLSIEARMLSVMNNSPCRERMLKVTSKTVNRTQKEKYRAGIY